MTQKSEAVLRARRELIQQTLDKICECQDFWELKRTTFVTFAHLWFHIKVKKENLFKAEELFRPECIIKLYQYKII